MHPAWWLSMAIMLVAIILIAAILIGLLPPS
jgi:hypothetical protein